MPRPPRRKAPPPSPAATPLLEWIAAAIGLALVLLTLGVVASEAFRADASPPRVVVETLGVERVGAGYLLRIRAANAGGSPAAGVVVEAELRRPGAATETAQASFDFIPDHSARRGGLFFASDPRQGQLTVGAKGYAEP